MNIPGAKNTPRRWPGGCGHEGQHHCRFMRSTVVQKDFESASQTDWYVCSRGRDSLPDYSIVGVYGPEPTDHFQYRLNHLWNAGLDHNHDTFTAAQVALEYVLYHHWARGGDFEFV